MGAGHSHDSGGDGVRHAHGGGGHDHAHHGHDHGIRIGIADPRWLWVALWILVAMSVVEVVAGIVSGSTALLSDAAHVLSDAGAIAIALVSIRIAQRPAKGAYTYGLARAETLGAQLNGVTLLVLAGMIGVGATIRLFNPPQVDGGVVVVTGIVGLIANIFAALALARANRESLAVEGAYQHALMDAISSVVAVLAGALIMAGVSDRIDPLFALFVMAMMFRSGWRILVSSARVLLEGAPAGVDPHDVGRALAAHPGVVEAHDLHVWELTQGFPAVTAHVVVEPDSDCHRIRFELQQLIESEFGIAHSTLQVDHDHRGELIQLDD